MHRIHRPFTLSRLARVALPLLALVSSSVLAASPPLDSRICVDPLPGCEDGKCNGDRTQSDFLTLLAFVLPSDALYKIFELGYAHSEAAVLVTQIWGIRCPTSTTRPTAP